MTKITVSNCSECPMCMELDMANGYKCNAVKIKDPYIKQHKKKFTPITPEWCPLIEGGITIVKGGLINNIKQSLKSFEVYLMTNYGEIVPDGAVEEFIKNRSK